MFAGFWVSEGCLEVIRRSAASHDLHPFDQVVVSTSGSMVRAGLHAHARSCEVPDRPSVGRCCCGVGA